MTGVQTCALPICFPVTIVSGGTYRDWLETVYTTGQYIERPETPIFEGGMTQYIEFDEVVSQSATEEEPLGTLAGRGKNTCTYNHVT